MKLSTKGRYAMVALCDISLHGGSGLVTLSDISKRQKISLAYLEQPGLTSFQFYITFDGDVKRPISIFGLTFWSKLICTCLLAAMMR